MLICSTPYSGAEEFSKKFAKTLGLKYSEYEGSAKPSKGWSDWPLNDGVNHKSTTIEKWISDDSTVYNIHLIPSITSHRNSIITDNLVVILRNPEEIYLSLPKKEQTKSILQLLKIYYREWLKLARQSSNIMLIRYEKIDKALIKDIARHLGIEVNKKNPPKSNLK